MVQGDRTKGTKASSAKAAQLLGSAAAGQPVAVGFGGYAGLVFSGKRFLHACLAFTPCFCCRFTGAKQVPDSAPVLQDTSSSSITNLSTDAQSTIDSETLLHLKRLSKRDPITKHKALQASAHACHHAWLDLLHLMPLTIQQANLMA